MGSFAAPCLRPFSPSIVELFVMVQGIQVARASDCARVVIQSDCKTAVGLINNRTPQATEAGLLVAKIPQDGEAFSEFFFVILFLALVIV